MGHPARRCWYSDRPRSPSQALRRRWDVRYRHRVPADVARPFHLDPFDRCSWSRHRASGKEAPPPQRRQTSAVKVRAAAADSRHQGWEPARRRPRSPRSSPTSRRPGPAPRHNLKVTAARSTLRPVPAHDTARERKKACRVEARCAAREQNQAAREQKNQACSTPTSPPDRPAGPTRTIAHASWLVASSVTTASCTATWILDAARRARLKARGNSAPAPAGRACGGNESINSDPNGYTGGRPVPGSARARNRWEVRGPQRRCALRWRPLESAAVHAKVAGADRLATELATGARVRGQHPALVL
jgi:hypothetical protein